MIRVLIATDVRLFREGLVEVLGRRPTFEVVGVASHVSETLERVHDQRPDVLLLDVSMPDSVAGVRAIASLSPETRVIALALADTEAAILACAEAGVAGFVSRDGSLADLVHTVESVQRGEFVCSARVAGLLLRRVGSLALTPGPRTHPVLTGRELDVLRLLEQRLSNKEIAERLGIELPTVKNHVHSVLEKLHVHRRHDAVAWARGRLAK